MKKYRKNQKNAKKYNKKRAPENVNTACVKQTLLQKIAAVLDMGNESGLNDEFFGKAAPLLEEIASEMRVSPVQAALFAFIFDTSFMNCQNPFNDEKPALFSALKCSKVQYLEYLNEIDELEKVNYVNRAGNGPDPYYVIPRNIILSLRKGARLTPESNKNLTARQFFRVLESYFSARFEKEITYRELCGYLSSLLSDNSDTEFVKKINSYTISGITTYLLLYFCHVSCAVSYHNNGHGTKCSVNVNLDTVQELFTDEEDESSVEYSLIQPLQEGNSELHRLFLIENVNNDGLASGEEFALSAKAKRELLGGLAKNNLAIHQEMIKARDIKEKTMFYNRNESQKIDKLVNLLAPGNFREITAALAAKGFRSGFACLFSGAPGTGKTETVYQIARRTGRDLIQVDISKIKSKWVGDSEKNIKMVFDGYKAALEERDAEPILFFNEADAVIGKRMVFTESSRSVDQMENAIQNIILQEIENLNGILIATTNLVKNMDSAFERRFLYKIEFGKPEESTRRLLWQSMLPEMSGENTAYLASRFNFSGGQIENIARKHQIDLILDRRSFSEEEDKRSCFETIIGYCEDESLVKETRNTIGFALER